MNRRQWLVGASASLLFPGTTLAFGEASAVDVAELDLGPGTVSRPDAWTRMLADLRATTAVETRDMAQQGVKRLKPEDPALFEHPFLVCMGAGAFGPPSEEGLEMLSRYLAYGGFLLLDDTSGSMQSPFDTSARRLVQALFPTRQLTPLPKTHSVYRSFFLLERPFGRVSLVQDLEGVTLGGVRVEGERREDTTNTPVMLMRNDLSGALERDRAGRHPYAVVPGGESQRREAVKLSVNLMMYALTSNYKRDQVHVKELIERQRAPRGFVP
jgi:hypothetical protein